MKTSDGEARPVEPTLRLGLRGRLEHAGGVAAVGHLAQEPLQVDRLRRVQAGRAALAADAALDVREQTGRAAGRHQDRAQQECGRRLPVGSRHPGDGELGCRVAEEEDGRDGHRRPNVGHDELRQPQRQGALDDERGGAPLGCGRSEVVPVLAASPDAKEERPRADGSRVVGEVGDLDRNPIASGDVDDLDRPERRDEALKVHRAPSLPGGSHPAPASTAAPRPPATRRSADDAPPALQQDDRGRARDLGWPRRGQGAVSVFGSSGGTPRYCRSNFAIAANAGAATTPPKIEPRGSSTLTRTTRRGCEAGTMPTKEAV